MRCNTSRLFSGRRVALVRLPRDSPFQRREVLQSLGDITMVNKCCVPRCRGNYRNGPKVHAFSFPSNAELRQKWLDAIPRQYFQPGKHSKVRYLIDPRQVVQVLVMLPLTSKFCRFSFYSKIHFVIFGENNVISSAIQLIVSIHIIF